MTGVVWRDDSQIVLEALEKVYADHPGATITVTRLAADHPASQRANGQQLAMAITA